MNRCYLFDFDRTLVDSMPTFVSAMLRILDENKIRYNREITKSITPLELYGSSEGGAMGAPPVTDEAT